MSSGVLIILFLAASISGTAFLADSAIPGEKLYGIDRQLESFRLKVTREENIDKVKIAHAKERLKEVNELFMDDTLGFGISNGEDKKKFTWEDAQNVETGLQNALEILIDLSERMEDNPGVENAVLQITDGINSYIDRIPDNVEVEIDASESVGEEDKDVLSIKRISLKIINDESDADSDDRGRISLNTPKTSDATQKPKTQTKSSTVSSGKTNTGSTQTNATPASTDISINVDPNCVGKNVYETSGFEHSHELHDHSDATEPQAETAISGAKGAISLAENRIDSANVRDVDVDDANTSLKEARTALDIAEVAFDDEEWETAFVKGDKAMKIANKIWPGCDTEQQSL